MCWLRTADVVGEISITGGGARFAYWGQLLAAALNRPLTYRAGSEIGAALGAARLARLAVTGESPQLVCRLPPITHVVEPDPSSGGIAGAAPRHLCAAVSRPSQILSGVRSMSVFSTIEPMRFEGRLDQRVRLSRLRPDRMVLGKRMEDWLKVAVCYWHSFNWPGTDIFGGGTLPRPWLGTPVTQAMADQKLEAAFDFLSRLGVPLFHLPRCGRHGLGRPRARARDSICGASRRRWPRKWLPPASSCCGARPICSAIRAMPAAPRPARTRRCSPGRPRRCAAAWRRRIGWAGRTTCCGADAKATTRC